MLPYPLRRDDHQLLTPPEWAKLLVLQALECCAQACSGGALGKGEIIIESDVLLLPQALAARERMVLCRRCCKLDKDGARADTGVRNLRPQDGRVAGRLEHSETAMIQRAQRGT